MEPFTLTTERLLLDELQPDDAQTIFEFCQDPEFERYLTIPWPYRLGDARYFITEHVPSGWSSAQELSWAVRTSDGTLLGVVGLRSKLGRFDIGFWLGSPHRGNGYMPEAVRAVLDWAFESGVASEVSWECVAGNLASATVARKLGFTFGGVRPSVLPSRDGSHPESWHGLLRASDDRSPKPGWPLPSAPAENEGVSAS
ncbi:MAG TPA: GNAT family N-acetyltransferase [Homoserinimonas sp.]|nr:GNAT family N-acetyltransferase [Homoserinimonas sp.]